MNVLDGWGLNDIVVVYNFKLYVVYLIFYCLIDLKWVSGLFLSYSVGFLK